MDPRARKLRLALWIMGVGMALALAWHAWQGWGLGQGYPHNSFVCLPQYRFDDLATELESAREDNPFATNFYFPATYIFLRPFACIPDPQAVWLFLGLNILGLVWLQSWALRPFVTHPVRRILANAALLLCSYAVLICVDRGNLEMTMVLLIGAGFVLCSQRRFGLASLLFAASISIKPYPLLLLVVFLRRHHVRHIVLPTLGFVLVSVLSLFAFSAPVDQILAAWKHHLVDYNVSFVFYDNGLAGCASLWNLIKVVLLTLNHFHFPGLHLDSARHPLQYGIFFSSLSRWYTLGYLVVLIGIALYVSLVEPVFFRRAIVLSLLIPFAVQSGSDYRLLYVQLSLLLLMALPVLRRRDLAVVALLALTLVPKKLFFLTYLGSTDSGVSDVSIGVILDPLLIIAALVLLLRDAWQERIPGYALNRTRGLLDQLMGPASPTRRHRVHALTATS